MLIGGLDSGSFIIKMYMLRNHGNVTVLQHHLRSLCRSFTSYHLYRIDAAGHDVRKRGERLEFRWCADDEGLRIIAA